MYKPQQRHLVELQDTAGSGPDSASWLSGVDDSSLSRTFSSLSAAIATATATGNVDRVLFNDLVEMVPLVQSLIERKANSSFTRKAPMIYTKTPSRESLYKKTTGRSALQTKKQREEPNENTTNNQDRCDDNFSIFSSRSLLSEKDREELMALRDQLEDLKRQLSEKDELLKSAELLESEMTSMHLKFTDLKNEVTEKDSLIKSSQLQLSDAKIKLADKQAAVEKLQWEAMTSNKKVEKLQGDLTNVEGEISCFMSLIEGLARTDLTLSDGNYEFLSHSLEENFESESLTEIEMQELEAARVAYIAAVAEAKEKQDDESVAAAAKARFHLQSVVLK
ncbi:protein MICROTUBULE BINDING PROTEIN 2C-like [Primulina huaijiensis]|uniref:protein MICROTUBULE BINDING PROTEIN 2C-like n=1 Tax=Primulina huaijiensis TaxID=1492673 RepID=UPI003CC770DF